MIAEGIMSIQQGDVPLILRKKLTAFIMAHIRQK
jgi:flagellar motor component MotA